MTGYIRFEVATGTVSVGSEQGEELANFSCIPYYIIIVLLKGWWWVSKLHYEMW